MSGSVSYSAELDMRRDTVLFVSGLLAERRRQHGNRHGRRALSPFKQTVLVMQWFLDATRARQLAGGNGIGVATCYRYLHETITMLAEHVPALGDVLAQAVEAGLTHVNLDGTVLVTDRVATPGPNGADLWSRASTNTTAATSKSSRPLTAGHSGSALSDPAGTDAMPA